MPVLVDRGAILSATSLVGWPIIEGTHAVEILDAGSMTAVLETTTETELELRVRYGGVYQGTTTPVVVDFFDADAVTTVTLDAPANVVFTSPNGAFYASDVHTLVAPLPPLAVGHRFAVRLRVPTQTICGFAPPATERIVVEQLRAR